MDIPSSAQEIIELVFDILYYVLVIGGPVAVGLFFFFLCVLAVSLTVRFFRDLRRRRRRNEIQATRKTKHLAMLYGTAIEASEDARDRVSQPGAKIEMTETKTDNNFGEDPVSDSSSPPFPTSPSFDLIPASSLPISGPGPRRPTDDPDSSVTVSLDPPGSTSTLFSPGCGFPPTSSLTSSHSLSSTADSLDLGGPRSLDRQRRQIERDKDPRSHQRPISTAVNRRHFLSSSDHRSPTSDLELSSSSSSSSEPQSDDSSIPDDHHREREADHYSSSDSYSSSSSSASVSDNDPSTAPTDRYARQNHRSRRRRRRDRRRRSRRRERLRRKGRVREEGEGDNGNDISIVDSGAAEPTLQRKRRHEHERRKRRKKRKKIHRRGKKRKKKNTSSQTHRRGFSDSDSDYSFSSSASFSSSSSAHDDDDEEETDIGELSEEELSLFGAIEVPQQELSSHLDNHPTIIDSTNTININPIIRSSTELLPLSHDHDDEDDSTSRPNSPFQPQGTHSSTSVTSMGGSLPLEEEEEEEDISSGGYQDRGDGFDDLVIKADDSIKPYDSTTLTGLLDSAESAKKAMLRSDEVVRLDDEVVLDEVVIGNHLHHHHGTSQSVSMSGNRGYFGRHHHHQQRNSGSSSSSRRGGNSSLRDKNVKNSWRRSSMYRY